MNPRAWFYAQSFNGWTRDLDPILDRSEEKHEAEEILECERCGAIVERLITVDDDDFAVGYHSSLDVCENCNDARKGNR